MDKNPEIIEEILKAIDIISKSNSDTLTYDQTFICEIVDNSDAKNGRYLVTDGFAKYDAFSETTSYAIGAQVRVTVLQGDSTQTKYITGLATNSDMNQPITYLSALNTILDMQDLTRLSNFSREKEIGLVANGTKELELIWDFDFKEHPNLWTDGLYTSLFVEASFKTNLEHIKSGSYGLFLRVNIKMDNGQLVNIDYTFDNDEYFGNPYKFFVFTNQSKKFNIKDFKQIDSISLWFYQRNDFKTVFNEKYEPVIVNDKQVADLFVSNIRIGLGTDLSDIEDNTVKLTTINSLGYYNNEQNYNKEVQIDFWWFNKDDENKYVGFSDGAASKKIESEEDWINQSGEDGNLFGIKLDKNRINTVLTSGYKEHLYIEATEQEQKLESKKSSNVPTDEYSLNLMVNIQEAHDALIEIKNLIELEYVPALDSFSNFMRSTDFPKNDFIINLDGLKNYIDRDFIQENDSLQTRQFSFLKYYKEILRYIALIQSSIKNEPPSLIKDIDRILPQDCFNLFYGNIFLQFNKWFDSKNDAEKGLMDILNNIGTIFTNIKGLDSNIKNNFPNYLKYYNDFLKKVLYIEKIFTDKKDIIDEKIPDRVNLEVIENTKSEDEITEPEDNYLFVGKIQEKQHYRNNFYYYKDSEGNYKIEEVFDQNKDYYIPLIKLKKPDSNFIFYKIIIEFIEIIDSKEIIIDSKDYDLKYYLDLTNEWEKTNYSITNNLYSIYWYRYEKDCEGDFIGGKDWKRLENNIPISYEKITSKVGEEATFEFQESENSLTLEEESWLPDEDLDNIDEDGSTYWKEKHSSNNKSSLHIVLNPQKLEDKFKVVLFYNHNKFESNVITFENLNHPNKSEIIKSTIIPIKHHVDSASHYAVYNAASHQLLNPSDGYLNRQVLAELDKASSKQGHIYWYFPAEKTQLTYDEKQIEAGKFSGKIGVRPIYTASVYTNGKKFKKIEFNEESYEPNKYYLKNINGNYKLSDSSEKDNSLTYYELQDNQKVLLRYDEKEGLFFDGISQNSETKEYSTNNGEQVLFKNLEALYVLQSDSTSSWYFLEVPKKDLTPNLIKEEEEKEEKIEIWASAQTMEKIYVPGEDGNICFSKKIDLDSNNDWEKSLSFPYQIKSSYEPLNENNVIYCQFIDNNGIMYEGNIGFTFGVFGSNGTDYTVIIKPIVDKKSIFIEGGNLGLSVEVRDKNNDLVDISDINYVWDNYDEANKTIQNNSGISSYICSEEEIGDNKKKYLRIELKDNGLIRYGILKIFVSIEGLNHKLTASYPIAWAAEEKYKLSGPTIVTYDSKGSLLKYDVSPYILSSNGEQINEANIAIKYLDSNFNIHPTGQAQDEKVEREILNYLPKIDQNDKSLLPNPLFINNLNVYPFIEVSTDQEVVFIQPLLIIQDQFESDLINKWNGQFKIDENNNYILTAMVGAGIKNDDDNSFSGVLMGDVQGKTGFAESGLGLYGFHRGGQSFGFNIDGTAFIGKSGAGRIRFDGDRGLIYSASWENSFYKTDEKGNKVLIDNSKPPIRSDGTLGQGSAGMAIDLLDGHIDAYNFKLTGGTTLLLQSDPGSNEDYLFLGQSDNSYIQFTKNGDLNIKVSSFSLSSNGEIDSTVIEALNPSFVTPDEFTQQTIVEKMVNGGDTIKIIDGHIFINATRINTGVLHSSNWIETGGKINDNGEIIKSGTQGMAISLLNGHIDAYDFKLTGGNSLYLNSNPNSNSNDDYYFKINHQDNNYLRFTKDGALQISVEGDNSYFNAKNFTLDAESPLTTFLNINIAYWSKYQNEPTNIKISVEAQVCLQIATGIITFENDNYKSHFSGGWSFVLEHWKEYLKIGTADLTEDNWKRILTEVYDINGNGGVDSEDSRYINRMGHFLKDLSSRLLKLQFNKESFSISREYTYSNNTKKIEKIFEVNKDGVNLSDVQLFNMKLLSTEDTKYADPIWNDKKIIGYNVIENSTMPKEYKIEENGRYFKIEPFQLIEEINKDDQGNPIYTVDHPYSALIADFEGYGAFTGGNSTQVVKRRLWITPKEIISEVDGVSKGTAPHLSLDWHDLLTAAVRIIRNWGKIKDQLDNIEDVE